MDSTLIIDRGNSRLKLGWYRDGQRRRVWQGPLEAWEAVVAAWLRDEAPLTALSVGWLSVAQPDWQPEALPLWQQVGLATQWHQIDHRWPFPLINRYATPETLGADRLVGVVAAKAHCPQQPVLVIDAGTALTYDLATADGQYLGGGIAPGLQMRLDALHHFTARLPQVALPPDEAVPLIGDSTANSIRVGCYQGILAEIEGLARRYRDCLRSDLQVFLTGGDLSRFENRLACVNFADPHLLLDGVHHLLTHRSSA